MRRKKIRLSAAVYREAGRAYSVTIATAARQKVFRDLAFGRACVGELGRISAATTARIYAYCLMPDHVHLLVGVPAGRSLSEIVGEWKSRCYTLWRRRGVHATLWQRSFYDHAVRADEDFRTAVEYVLNNPVKDGLAARREDYELCGSFEFDV